MTFKAFQAIQLFVLIVLSCSTVFSSENIYGWGGAGFDPALREYGSSYRFFAQAHDGDGQLMDIGVDSKETQQEIGRIRLTSDIGTAIDSQQCWKTMRHLTAPSACSFLRKDIENLNGKGRIEIFSKEESVILGEDVDFDAMRDKLGLE